MQTVSTISQEEKLRLFRNAVAAKAAYWDAFGALERGCTAGEEFLDRQNDAVEELISNCAVGLTSPEDVDTSVDEGTLPYLDAILAKR